MKKRIAALFLASFVCFSLAACGADGSISGLEENTAAEEEAEEEEEPEAEAEEPEAEAEVAEAEEPEAETPEAEAEEPEAEAEEPEAEAEDHESEGEYHANIPDAITNLSPEDDKALTGVLTEDSYTNEYFGLVFNAIPGGTMSDLFEEGTELTPLSESYANGFGGVYVYCYSDKYSASLSASVSAISSADQGKSEEQMAQERFDLEQSLNESMMYEADCSVESISVAGEKHPAYVEIVDFEGVMRTYATIYVIKNDFYCTIDVTCNTEDFDQIVKLIEPLN